MNELQTIFDDISYEITNSLQGTQFARNALNEHCRAIAYHIIHCEEKKNNYLHGTEEENEIQKGLCLLVHITSSLIAHNPESYRGLLEIYEYLDPNLTEKIEKHKAIAVIRRVFETEYTE